ncbi:MAG: hypothetical protein KME07_06425 [Pegethrix bostrychoides GSE-TBD4-15B]|jgi:hypothetical protein|uniref:Uncharacterized protein n=1 Tax=Pegethrix bostrychoides GSE-TBD4-15B TaxID=2839662 RepID=A0A951U3Y0_9CYAN|nr:hypothetical protein [Pegethrix bostrychoides GSE-TBD4-15B]
MQLIDVLIEGSVILGCGYIATMFIAGLVTRHTPSPSALAAPELMDDPIINAVELWPAEPVRAAAKAMQPEARLIISEAELADPTDASLVLFAKSVKWPGSSKWAKTRKLSPNVRAGLIERLNAGRRAA